MARPWSRLLALMAVVGGPACHTDALGRVPFGTWGGEDAAVLVAADGVHVHIGCTKGDIQGVPPLDAEGRFDVEGSYNIDAYPVDRGILHPARFTGRTDGRSLTIAVRLTDIGQSFGPVLVFLGQEPRMRMCPICRESHAGLPRGPGPASIGFSVRP